LVLRTCRSGTSNLLDPDRPDASGFTDPVTVSGSRSTATDGSSIQIKNRGVEDACMVVCDGLKGVPESIQAT